MSQPTLHPESRLTLAFLAAIVALGPLSVDMYLPAMPAMQRELNTDIVHMHLTLSAYLWGFALFHLVCGPLADRYGRRPVLLTSLFVMALDYVVMALAGTIWLLLAGRIVGGITAG